jgi:hypothetical protein
MFMLRSLYPVVDRDPIRGDGYLSVVQTHLAGAYLVMQVILDGIFLVKAGNR